MGENTPTATATATTTTTTTTIPKKTRKKRESYWNVVASSDDNDNHKNLHKSGSASGGGKVHDTELVVAIKANENKPSHRADLAQLAALHNDTVKDGYMNTYEEELRKHLSKAVFVGHVNTDLDSVAGAMGAAALFGGTAAISEPLESLNGEVSSALKNCGLEPPQQFDDLMRKNNNNNNNDNSNNSDDGLFDSDCPVCLVDHTEETQMVPSLRSNYADRVIGVIDHHALAKSFRTKRPIFMDLRPWGSMSTIVGYLFVLQRHNDALTKPLAVLLMQAILSDTLNLRSVTTTDADRSMVALLHSYGGIGNAAQSMALELKGGKLKGTYQDTRIDYLSQKQFQAKTNWVVALGPYEMVRGDQKDFSCGPWKFGISVLEVTDTTRVMTEASCILSELRLLKKEKALIDDDDDDDEEDTTATMDRTLELDFAFLFVVNIVTEVSTLLICGGRELALAKAAFLESPDIGTDTNRTTLHEAAPGICAPGYTIESEETAMTLPKGYVSRKAQFVPAIFQAIEDFEYDRKGPMSETTAQDHVAAASENHGQRHVNEIAQAVQEQVERSKRGEQHPTSSSITSSSTSSSSQRKRRQSSLRRSYHSNAMETMIFLEQQVDQDLVEANQKQINNNNGNLYDIHGRVLRTYE